MREPHSRSSWRNLSNRSHPDLAWLKYPINDSHHRDEVYLAMQYSSRRSIYAVLSACFAIAAAARCGGGEIIDPHHAHGGGGSLSGIVIKGRVSGATVTAYALDAVGKRGSALGSAITDASGVFTITNLPSYNGPVLLAATAGTYAEEAVPDANIRLDAQELTFLLGSYQASTSLTDLTISPISHLAAGLALRWVEADGKTIATAADDAWTHLNNHFGGSLGAGLDWRKVTPANFGVPGLGQLDAAGRAGLLLAALSMEARTIAERAGLTPGTALSSLALVEALYQDVRADGYFDGQGSNGPLLLPAGGFLADAGPTAYALDDQTLRFALGQAVQRFIESDRNQSGLTLTDVGPLIQALASNSDSRLFRSAGVDFDHDAPTATWTATYSRGAGPDHPVLKPTRLAGGMLRVKVEVSDASTIQGALFSANGVAISATATGSGSLITYALVLDTTTVPDGPLSLSALVSDVHGNVATRVFSVLVDNTPPTITIADGSPSQLTYYHGSVPIDVSASDVNGVTAFTLSSLQSFSNQSGVLTRIAGVWTIPAGTADGVVPAGLSATDSAFNVATLPLKILVDQTPPSVSLIVPVPPLYTRSSSVTVHVAAADTGSGVAQICASNSVDADVCSAPNSDNTATLTVPLGVEGKKRIVYWAVDAAIAPNSGRSTSAQQSFDITYDNSPPVITESAVGSYIREDAMTLVEASPGVPTMPATYAFPAPGTKEAVYGGNNHIYKASTRLAWGAAPSTAATLLNQVAATGPNIPFIAYDVSFNSTIDAPVTRVYYRVRCFDSSLCGSFPQAVGDLLEDLTYTGGGRRFLLPISSENVPGIAQLPSAAPLSIEIFADDAAGNTAASPASTYYFHVCWCPPFRLRGHWVSERW